MGFPENVERWRYNVQIAITKASVSAKYDPVTILTESGLTVTQFINYVLGIIEKESRGNQFCLGDLLSGQSIPRQPKNIVEATGWIERANSIGLMQLNYGVGTPQDMGYAGDKVGLTDPDVNVYFGIQYFLDELNRYRSDYNDLQEALSAYNAGHAIVSNKASYVDAIIQFVTDAVDAAGGGATDEGEKKT